MLTPDGLSIPFFVSGRRVQSMTYTWSRNPSIAGGDEPAWTTHTTRVHQGGDVVVNRDDEEGDIGMQGRHRIAHEKLGRDSSGDSSATQAYQSEKDAQAPSDPPTGVPPHAAYREGHDLVTEHAHDGQREVHVNVERDVFKTTQEKKAFDQKGMIPEHALERVASTGAPLQRITTSDSHSTNAMSDVGEGDGDGYRRRPYHWHGSGSTTPAVVEPTASTRSDRDPADAPTNPIHSYISADRVKKRQPEAGWRRFLRTRTGDSSNSAHSWAEEGRAGEPAFLPTRTRTKDSRRPSITERLSPWARSHTLEPPQSGIPLTRTVSFAPNAAPSSETAPSMANYGSATPGFKKTPSLGMFRTSSLHPDEDPEQAKETDHEAAFKREPSLELFRTHGVRPEDEGPSVTFEEPKK